MVVREARVTDADKLVRLIQQVETESEFMLMEAGERQMTPEQQGQRIESCKKSENSSIFVAEKDNQLIGYLFAIGGNARRVKHSGKAILVTVIYCLVNYFFNAKKNMNYSEGHLCYSNN